MIFDMATTCALGPLAKPGFWDFMGGVTRCLNISYLRAVPIGIKVRLYCQVMHVGRTAAMLHGEMTSLDGKVVYCTAENQRIAVPTQKWHMGEKFEVDWDREMREDVKSAEGVGLMREDGEGIEVRDGSEGVSRMKGRSKL